MNETKVMVDFRYPADGCQTVMLTGSFLNWKDQLPLQKEVESNEFRLTIPLPVGIHHYKYIVDGEWTVLSTEPTMKDLDGNENNCIAVRRPIRKHHSQIPCEWEEVTSMPSPLRVSNPSLFRNHLMLPGVDQVPKPVREDEVPLITYASGRRSSNLDKVRQVKHKLLLVLVGLPARGKSFISQKLGRYLDWLGFTAKVFNVSSYRMKILGRFYAHDWYDPDNKEGERSRMRISQIVLADIYRWFEESEGIVAILDGTNCTTERRQMIIDSAKARKPGLFIRTIFLEIIVNDLDVIMNNIRSSISSPDYQGMDEDEIVSDCVKRIQHYRKVYTPVSDNDRYLRVFNTGGQIVMNRVTGFLPSKLMFYLSNLRTATKQIFFVRHGESEYNLRGLIGGDSSLTDRGHAFARRLREWVKKNIPDATENLSVWSSTMTRAVQTAEDVPCNQYIRWKVLDEIEAGTCDSMTYEQIEETYPEEFEARQKDKLRYCYPRGESYEDLIRRIEPVIIELERRDRPVMVIAHQASLRCIYGYFSREDYTRSQVPHIDFPAECILSVTPRAYGSVEEKIFI